MDAVTYPAAKVTEFIQKEIVPLRIQFNTQPFKIDFNVQWTPTLITLDVDGKEHYRTVGFLSPEELIPSLLLGMAKCHFDQERFDQAISSLDRLLTEYPKSDSAPEAFYLRGVSRYKSTHDQCREAFIPVGDRDVLDRPSRHFRLFVQLARQKAASLKHALTYPEMTAMLGCVHGAANPDGQH